MYRIFTRATLMPTTPIWKHFAAFLYDVFPLLGVFLATSLVVLLAREGIPVERYSPWFTALLLFEFAGYYVYSWKVGGQTLGMRAWKMKIFPNTKNQDTLTWGQASFRLLIGTVSTCLFGLGLFWKLFSKNHESWMDLASHSTTKTLDI